MSHRLPIADIEFIADFAAFCRTKGDERYDYSSHTHCACSQFLRATGRAKNPYQTDYGWYDGLPHPDKIGLTPLSNDVNDALAFGAKTFSALADRLEALIADAPAVAKASA